MTEVKAAFVIAAKDIKQRLRDRSAYIVGILAPLVLAAIFSFVFNPIEEFEFSANYLVVDEDGGPVARLFVEEGLVTELAELFVEGRSHAVVAGIEDAPPIAAFPAAA